MLHASLSRAGQLAIVAVNLQKERIMPLQAFIESARIDCYNNLVLLKNLWDLI